MSQEAFRFSSRKEYEIDISKIVFELQAARSSKLQKKKLKELELRYEELIEEYMRFCGSGDREDGE